MVALVLKSKKEMGSTGEGLTKASDVTLDHHTPAFVNKWGQFHLSRLLRVDANYVSKRQFLRNALTISKYLH